MKYGKRILEKAKKALKKGLNDSELALAIGVRKSTISEWKQKHPEFANLCTLIRDRSVENVVNALYQRSMGMDTQETHTVIKKDKTGKKIQEVKKVKKHLAPDVQAISLYLRNKDPENWRDRREDLIAMVSKEDLRKSSEEIDRLLSVGKEKKEEGE